MRIRLSWQNLAPPNERKLVEEIEITSPVYWLSLHAWAMDVFRDRWAECPDRWGPEIEVVDDEADESVIVRVDA